MTAYFSFLTYNTMGAPFKPKTAQRYGDMAKRFIQLIETEDLHIIALQETFNEKLRDQHLVSFTEQIEWTVSKSDNRKGFLLNAGLTTLSADTPIDVKYISFSSATGVDRFVRKGALLTRIDVGELKIDYYNSHTQASYISQKIRSGVRIHQIQELLGFILDTRREDAVVVLAGDLNFEEYNEEYRMITDNGEIDFIDCMRQLYPCSNTYPMKTLKKSKPHKERKLDHVFIHLPQDWTWNSEKSEIYLSNFDLSDHRPVLSKLFFEKR